MNGKIKTPELCLGVFFFNNEGCFQRPKLSFIGESGGIKVASIKAYQEEFLKHSGYTEQTSSKPKAKKSKLEIEPESA